MFHLGRKISSMSFAIAEIYSRIGPGLEVLYKYSRLEYDHPYIGLDVKFLLLKTEVIETMLYGCVNWTIAPDKFST